MAVEVILPKVDMDMATGKIIAWHVRDGETVRKGQPIFDIETDKAAMEIESSGDGIIRIIAPEIGHSLPIGTVVAMIFEAGEEAGAVMPVVAPSAPAAAAPPQEPVAAPARDTVTVLPGVAGTRATPLARRLARETGVRLHELAGSGPGGRVVAADVRQAAERKSAAAVAAQTPAGLMVLGTTCRIDALLGLLDRLNRHAPAGPGQTPQWTLAIDDVVLKAWGLALQQVPAANAALTPEGFQRKATSDIAICLGAGDGEVCPVIRGTDNKSLSALAVERTVLAEKAASGQLRETGNLGAGSSIRVFSASVVEGFSAPIEGPGVTSLAVGATVPGFIPVDGAAVPVTQVSLTLSCDPQAISTHVAAELLAALKRLMEEPALMLL